MGESIPKFTTFDRLRDDLSIGPKLLPVEMNRLFSLNWSCGDVYPSRENKMSFIRISMVAGVVLFLAGQASAQWVTFTNQTASRLSAAPANGSADTEEKDYAWGDVDKDGDTDLVSVRKQPFYLRRTSNQFPVHE